jgi:hypothetical protein
MFIPCISLDTWLLIYPYACPYSLAEHPARRADLAIVVLPALISLFSKCRLFFSTCLTLLNVLRDGPLSW